MDLSDRLGGKYEIATLLGVSMTTVKGWIERRATIGFPDPIVKLTVGDIYYLPSVQDWHDAWRRTRG